MSYGRGLVLNFIFVAGVFAVANLANPSWTHAGPGPCAASIQGATGGIAFVSGFAASQHTGCTNGVLLGNATSCNIQTTLATSSLNAFLAAWGMTTTRTMDISGGCSFMCASGDCRVGNDGLPVELLRFGVE